MFAVPPVTPVTTPVVSVVAMDISELLQTPPVVASVRLMVLPGHTVVRPLIALITGSAFTVSTMFTVVVQPKLLVTL